LHLNKGPQKAQQHWHMPQSTRPLEETTQAHGPLSPCPQAYCFFFSFKGADDIFFLKKYKDDGLHTKEDKTSSPSLDSSHNYSGWKIRAMSFNPPNPFFNSFKAKIPQN
jgi:hypothetical protein